MNFSKRRSWNAFALNQAIISNEIKSSTPVPQKMQNTLGTKKDRLGEEKVKKKLRIFSKKLKYFKMPGTLKATCQGVQQQVGTEWV